MSADFKKPGVSSDVNLIRLLSVKKDTAIKKLNINTTWRVISLHILVTQRLYVSERKVVTLDSVSPLMSRPDGVVVISDPLSQYLVTH